MRKNNFIHLKMKKILKILIILLILILIIIGIKAKILKKTYKNQPLKIKTMRIKLIFLNNGIIFLLRLQIMFLIKIKNFYFIGVFRILKIIIKTTLNQKIGK